MSCSDNRGQAQTSGSLASAGQKTDNPVRGADKKGEEIEEKKRKKEERWWCISAASACFSEWKKGNRKGDGEEQVRVRCRKGDSERMENGK